MVEQLKMENLKLREKNEAFHAKFDILD